MKPGYRPERRNRKIGTSSSGFKHRNKFDIPGEQVWSDRHGFEIKFYENLKPTFVLSVDFLSELKILYESPRDGSTDGCEPADVVKILAQLPPEDLYLLKYIIFRQPTRKQEIFAPVWGRCLYQFNDIKNSGVAIMLEAVDLTKPIVWDVKLDIDDAKEFERLIEDGHQIEHGKRTNKILLTEDSVRNTMLYRTLLHEVGHLAEYTNIFRGADENLQRDYDEYFSKPVREREDLAHRYAAEKVAMLRERGVIPFDRAE